MKSYVGEVIGEDFLQKWKCGNNVYVETAPDTGKTTFIMKNLLLAAKERGEKILLLVPRTILREQLEAEFTRILGDNVFDYDAYAESLKIMTYQSLNQRLMSGGFFPYFDYIVADESHYFLNDATFSSETVIAYNYIKSQTNSIRIFMSGTMTNFKSFAVTDFGQNRHEMVKGENGGPKFEFTSPRHYFEYNMPHNYDFVDISYYTKHNQMLDYICKSEGKSLIFVTSKERGEKFYEILKNRKVKVAFINADNKTAEMEPVVRRLAKTFKFEETVLIATSVLDVGVSIHDPEVTNVVIEAHDRETFLQMLGRIRQKEESLGFRLFIHARRASDYNLLLMDLEKKLNVYQTFTGINSDVVEAKIISMLAEGSISLDLVKHCFYQGYGEDGKTHFFVNPLARCQDNMLFLEYTENFEGLKLDKDFFIRKQLSWMDKADEFSLDNFIEPEIQKIRLEEAEKAFIHLAEEYTDELKSAEKDNFLMSVKPFVQSVDPSVRNSLPLSVRKFNDFCQLHKIPIQIEILKNRRPTGYRVVLL